MKQNLGQVTKSKLNRRWIIILVGVCVIVAVFAYLFVQNREGSKNKNPQKTQPKIEAKSWKAATPPAKNKPTDVPKAKKAEPI